MFADYRTGHKISDVKRAYQIIDPEDLKKNIWIYSLIYLDGVKFKVLKSDEHKKKLKKWKNQCKIINRDFSIQKRKPRYERGKKFIE